MVSTGVGFAKTILFGEHFVVQGTHAIGASLSIPFNVTLTPAETLSTNIETGQIVLDASRKILDAFGLRADYRIDIDTKIPSGAGMGWSAAYSVALSRAAAAAQGMELTWKRIAEYAYLGEEVFHGNPSGIDNTLSSRRGAILFKKGEEPIPIELKVPLHIVIAYTGKVGITKEMVAEVARIRAEKPDFFLDLMKREETLVIEAKKCLEEGNLERLGELMGTNHEYLKQVGVSTPELEEVVSLAKENGALGAKLTGGGGGGCAIALVKGKKETEALVQAISSKYLVFEAQIG
jgi:mevalonate kinase